MIDNAGKYDIAGDGVFSSKGFCIGFVDCCSFTCSFDLVLSDVVFFCESCTRSRCSTSLLSLLAATSLMVSGLLPFGSPSTLFISVKRSVILAKSCSASLLASSAYISLILLSISSSATSSL
ncbi:hypothetical protein I3271_03150 [Photobacterium leiognathi]|uniref:hypothetical protein n=1 Tax=Photobacterium leiognathi TaxID=553611 RepID=UPI001EE07939|nr:hypothetical protein [Photobacterium leiognathi]MCG3883679.1 hypothetical protein [Photobacterium leiognathi]